MKTPGEQTGPIPPQGSGTGRAKRMPISARDLDQKAARRLGSLVSKLGATLELDELLAQVSRDIKRYVDYDNLAVLLLDDMGEELRFASAVGYPDGVTKTWRFGVGQGLVGAAAASGESQIVPDVREDERYICAAPGTRSEIVVPLIAGGRTTGVIDVGSTTPRAFDESHVRLIEYLSGPLASAIENARLYQNVRQQARSLSLMHEVSRELTSILDLEQLIQKVARTVKRLIDYHVFSLMLWSEQTQSLDHSYWLRYDERMPQKNGIPLGSGITGTAAALRRPIRVPNVLTDPRFLACGHDVPVRSELAIPLVIEDRLIGVLDLESTEFNAFSPQDEQMLSTLASSIAIAIDNARLYEKVSHQEQLMARDLSTARAIQKGLLPTTVPNVAGLQIAHGYCPARELGGDFYDFVTARDGRVAITIGDVAGKGTPAALYASLAVGMLRGRLVRDALDPGCMLRTLNKQLRQHGIDNLFVAMLYAVYAPEEKSLTFSAAGLPRPWLVRAGEAREIDFEGVPLGIVGEAEFSEIRLTLRSGDLIVFTTDGLTEATSPDQREFGSEGVRTVLESIGSASPDAIVAGLLHARERHTGGVDAAADDCTIIVLKAS